MEEKEINKLQYINCDDEDLELVCKAILELKRLQQQNKELQDRLDKVNQINSIYGIEDNKIKEDKINKVLSYMQDNYDIYSMIHSDLWSKCYDYISKTFNLSISEKSTLISECVKELEIIKNM